MGSRFDGGAIGCVGYHDLLCGIHRLRQPNRETWRRSSDRVCLSAYVSVGDGAVAIEHRHWRPRQPPESQEVSLLGVSAGATHRGWDIRARRGES